MIESHSFYGCTQLKDIKLCEGLNTLGPGAFQLCSSLKEIKIPATVNVIETEAFKGCTQLKEVELCEGLNTLGPGVFQLCSSLKEIAIPSTVTEIRAEAFKGSTQLMEVKVRERLQTIGMSAFAGCVSLQQIHIPTTVTSFDWTAFDNCGHHYLVIAYSSEVQELLSRLTLEQYGMNNLNLSKMIDCFTRYSISQRLDKVKAEKWPINIESMLKGIVATESKDYSEYCCSIDSKLSAYVNLTEVSSLLELALWKAAISDHEETNPNHVDHGANKLQYRRICSSSVIISHVLSFLMSNAVEDVGTVHANSN